METTKDHLVTRLLATHPQALADLLLVFTGTHLRVATPTDLETGMRAPELGVPVGLFRLLLDLEIGSLGMATLG